MSRRYGWSMAGMSLVLAVVNLSSVRAQELHMSFTYDGSYEGYDPYTDTLGDPTDYSLTDATTFPEPDDVHVFSVYYELTGTSASPDQSLWGILFDVKLTGGLIPYRTDAWGGGENGDEPDGIPEGYWRPATSSLMYDPLGPLANAPVFPVNGDYGPPPYHLSDLQRIVIMTQDNPAYAHGTDVGESGVAPPWGPPLKLGEFWLGWNGRTYTAASVGLRFAASAFADPWAYWEGATGVVPDPASFLVDTPDMRMFSFSGHEVPEPASVVLAGLAMLGLMAFVRRRR